MKGKEGKKDSRYVVMVCGGNEMGITPAAWYFP